jgi:acetyl-CoA decarbonylase/synthase complex subunit alpha
MKISGKNIKLYIGDISEEDEEWKEVKGPDVKPSVTHLREWDRNLLERYRPRYHPFVKECQFCAFGPCDLSKGRRGACGITLDVQMSRENLFLTITGAAAHAAHARHVLHYLIEKFGRNHSLDVAENTEVEAPWFRTIIGKRPKTLGDLKEGLDYEEEHLTHLLSSLHMGQESSDFDFNSKALHAGMLDHLGMEIADIIQITALGFPKGSPEPGFSEIGFGTINKEKPVILCIGHNVCGVTEIIDYARGNNHDVEIAGICCTAIDMTRYDRETKIVGQLSYQLPFVRSGIADLIVIDEQCIRVDTIENAEKLGIPVISTSDKSVGGLPERRNEDPDQTVRELTTGTIKGCYIPDLEKLGEVAVKTALSMKKGGKKKRVEDAIGKIKDCRLCGICTQACPVGRPVTEMVASINYHYNKIKPERKGDKEIKVMSKEELMNELSKCIFCGRCESWCPTKLPLASAYSQVYKKRLENDRARIRVGRGAIQDVEIRNVGAPIVLGEIPGILAPVGCSLWPNGGRELGDIVEEFLKRNYIVAASGCSAMALATDFSGESHNLYEKYGGEFNAGNLINVGSCVSNPHITGAAMKVANIFAKRPLRGNFEEIADYVLNRVGAVGLVWGTYSQKAVSIGSGAMRLGVPVIWGPSGIKYRRELVSDENTNWEVYDTRSGEKYDSGPVPEHLSYVAKTKEEVMVLIPKLCMRAGDNFKGRQIKLAHYMDIHEKYYGKLPDDIHRFIRKESDIPLTEKERILPILEERDWKPVEKIPDPTLVKRLSGGAKTQ